MTGRRRLTDRRRRSPRAVTLVEVLISSVLVGVMIVAALHSVSVSRRTHRVAGSRVLGPALAEELMGEALSKPYGDPEDGAGPIGADSGELNTTRADFDDVDDYNGWDSANAEARDGSAIADFAGWRRRVSVQWVDPADVSAAQVSDTGLKRVTVTVTDPDGAETVLEALRWKDGALEQAPEADMTAVTSVGAKLQLGKSPLGVRTAAGLTNHASDSN